jgi:hypothetical protein
VQAALDLWSLGSSKNAIELARIAEAQPVLALFTAQK